MQQLSGTSRVAELYYYQILSFRDKTVQHYSQISLLLEEPSDQTLKIYLANYTVSYHISVQKNILKLIFLKIKQYSEAMFLDFILSISYGSVSSEIYDIQDDFNFEIVNFPFLDGNVPHPLHMVYIFHSLLVLQGCVLMLMTSTTETYL